MATLTRSKAPTGTRRRPGSGRDAGSRPSRWRASWRVALRMATRDARRYRGRSLLVLSMVAIPVALLVGSLTFVTSSTVTGVERLPTSLGRAAALLQGPAGEVVSQTADPEEGWATSGDDQPPKAVPVPGLDDSASLASSANVAAVQRLTGGKVVPVGSQQVRRVLSDGRTRAVQVTTYDTRVDLASKAVLVSGRWPTADAEIVATPYGLSRGMPRRGATTLRFGDQSRAVRVVGVANVFNDWGGQPDAVSSRPVVDAPVDWEYLLLRDDGMPYSEVKMLNRYGFRVTSAAALRHPPGKAELPPAMVEMSDYQARDLRTLLVAGGILLLVVTTLLVAPAFAVSASRQRRTLALAASNGAETRQLRRKVLAQALVLGALSAVTSALLAVAAVRVVMWALVQRRPWTTFRYFEVPWWAVAAVAAMAVLSALVAAAIPARRLGRLDIVGVMRGQNVSPRLNRLLPMAGLVLAGAGGIVLVRAVAAQQRTVTIAAASFALVLGALLLVPLILVVAGRLSRPLPFAARMASRDAARHRTRSVPTVAAIMAGTIALTTFSIGLASDTEQQRRDYRPQLLTGEGLVDLHGQLGGPAERGTPALDGAQQTVRRLAPGLLSSRLGELVAPSDPGTGNAASRFVTLLRDGCPVPRAVLDSKLDASGQPVCQLVSTNGARALAVLPAEEIARLAGLPAERAEAFTRGAVLVRSAALVSGGSVTVASGSVTFRPSDGSVQDLRTERRDLLPAVLGSLALRSGQFGAAVTPETAARYGWPVTVTSLLLHNPDGAVSRADEKALSEQLGDDASVYVERGFQRDDALVMRIMFAAFALLLVVVTLISTALALAEQQGDLGTLAAVGATRGTRRRLAAAQSATVALIGVGLGVAVGLAPGIAVSYPLTASSFDPETGRQLAPHPVTVVPWLPLALVMVAVPVVAAVLSASAVRRGPALTRRAD
ncbi:FtsX-like permease family protein [Pedococcus sp. 5OH_020]|uniref:FtsX-like permease family protein n=1 Tax=Pedococcus sp. 5OH_020 TaxID=2989814 RepID=UPI0022E9C9AD|nr:FtsX-like permease family protein [Pedococcus sp. 5OH_020]